jgi:hypothetical protein
VAAPNDVGSDDAFVAPREARPVAEPTPSPTADPPSDAPGDPIDDSNATANPAPTAAAPTATTRLDPTTEPEAPTSDNGSNVDPEPTATLNAPATIPQPRPTAPDGADNPPAGPDETPRLYGRGSDDVTPIAAPVMGPAGADRIGHYSAATSAGSWERNIAAGLSVTPPPGTPSPSNGGSEATAEAPALAAASWPVDSEALEAAVQRFLVGLDEVGQAVVRVVDGVGWAPTVTAAASLLAAYELSRRRGRKDRPAFIGPDPLAVEPA